MDFKSLMQCPLLLLSTYSGLKYKVGVFESKFPLGVLPSLSEKCPNLKMSM